MQRDGIEIHDKKAGATSLNVRIFDTSESLLLQSISTPFKIKLKKHFYKSDIFNDLLLLIILETNFIGDSIFLQKETKKYFSVHDLFYS